MTTSQHDTRETQVEAVKASAREQITSAAIAAGWTTDRGYPEQTADLSAGWSGSRGRRTLHVEFSVRGAVTYAATGQRRFDGTGKLRRVLDHIAEG